MHGEGRSRGGEDTSNMHVRNNNTRVRVGRVEGDPRVCAPLGFIGRRLVQVRRTDNCRRHILLSNKHQPGRQCGQLPLFKAGAVLRGMSSSGQVCAVRGFDVG